MIDPLAALLGLNNVEASVRRVIDTTALLAANQPEGVRAAAVAWFKKELTSRGLTVTAQRTTKAPRAYIRRRGDLRAGDEFRRSTGCRAQISRRKRSDLLATVSALSTICRTIRIAAPSYLSVTRASQRKNRASFRRHVMATSVDSGRRGGALIAPHPSRKSANA
jgi:hypothetical protein